MARRLRPIGPDHLLRLPSECVGCVFWESAERLEPVCGSACDPELLRERYELIAEEWGEFGRVAFDQDEILGFIKYAPARYFPQAQNFAVGPPSDKAVLLTCIHIRDDARRHGLGTLLLRAALRDVAMRGGRYVEAYACVRDRDMRDQPVMGVDFLLRNGFNVERPHPLYPLLRLDVRSLATWTENLETVFESLLIPLRHPQRVPSPSIKTKG